MALPEHASAHNPLPPLTTPQRLLAGLSGLFFGGLAVLGGWGSFDSVRRIARPWFGSQAWIVPVGVDLGILALVSAALLLEWIAMPMAVLRWSALAFTAATVWLNVSAAHGDPAGIIAHAAMPTLFILFVEAVRHAVRMRTGMVTGTRRDGIPFVRWLLAPLSTWAIWRRMVLWQVTSYPLALATEQRRRHAITLLRTLFGERWKKGAPADVVWMLKSGVMLDVAYDRVSELVSHQNDTVPDPQAGMEPAEVVPDAPSAPGERDTPAVPSRDTRQPATRRRPAPGVPSQNERNERDDGRPHRPADPADREAAALMVLAEEPKISGSELGRRLGLSPRQGQRLYRRLTDASTSPQPAISPEV